MTIASKVSWSKRTARLSGLILLLMLVLNLTASAGTGGGQSAGQGQGAERSQGRNQSSDATTEATTQSGSPDHSNTANCDGDSGGKSDTGHGANSGTEYDNTCPNAESMNGNGDGGSGRPCAGCVGQADDKNPKGQMPNAADDGNNGYECDGNSGIARTNPAHTGCARAQSTFGANATIGDLICGETSVLVTMNNTNNAAGGSRTFTVKLDGGLVSTHSVAAGGTATKSVTIPATGSHTVAVSSTGMTTVTKSGLSQADCTQRTFGANASIGSITCLTTTAAVSFNNTNNAAGGARSFTVLLDGAAVSTHNVASGGSGSTLVTIPATGSHNVSVQSAGMTTVTKGGLVRQTCVLGEKFDNPDGPKATKVLGLKLARTGADQMLLAIVALALLGLGSVLELGSRMRLVFSDK